MFNSAYGCGAQVALIFGHIVCQCCYRKLLEWQRTISKTVFHVHRCIIVLCLVGPGGTTHFYLFRVGRHADLGLLACPVVLKMHCVALHWTSDKHNLLVGFKAATHLFLFKTICLSKWGQMKTRFSKHVWCFDAVTFCLVIVYGLMWRPSCSCRILQYAVDLALWAHCIENSVQENKFWSIIMSIQSKTEV